MKSILKYLIILLIALGSYWYIKTDFNKTPDTIYTNGTIITLEDAHPMAQAMYVQDGLIKAIGSNEDMSPFKDGKTIVQDLKGAVIVPGLIDPHTHMPLSSFVKNMVDLSGFTHQTEAEVWSHLRESVKTKEAGQWIVGKGIDPILIKGLKSPHISFLDEIAPDNPVLLISQSLHTYWGNSLAFERAGISRNTKDPSNTSYYEKDEQGDLTGLIAEQVAVVPFLDQLRVEFLSPKSLIGATLKTFNDYAKNGNTTVVSTGLSIEDDKPLMLYKHLSEEQPSFVNQLLSVFGILPERSQQPRHFVYIRADKTFLLPDQKGPQNDFYDILGVKFWYDGSPYTGSMYLEEPYMVSDLTQNGLHIPDGYKGEALIDKIELVESIKSYQNKGWQVAIHSQGDLSNREVMDIYETVNKEMNIAPYRHRVEHCLLVSHESIDRMKSLNVTPSFHINHLYYYGNALKNEIIGEERVQRILPVGKAQQVNLMYSLHADQPMFESKPFRLIQTAVERQSLQGDSIGFDQSISVLNGLKSLTINAAWQIHMEDKIGSLKTGKYADFIILDKNPFEVEISELEKIKVLRTFVNGNEVE